ncbi:MAG: lysylphosphatidylglycerol synthase transmembrane domain-containing protein [Pseudomonadota bacterium]
MPKSFKPVLGAGASRAVRRLFAVIAIAALVYALRHVADIRAVSAMIRRAHPLWFGVALALQASTYCWLALGWSAVLRRAKSPQPVRRLIPIAVTKLFADQVVPSAGMGGNVVLVDRLMAIGVPRGAAVAALLVSMIGFYAAYAVLALAMLLVLWLHDHATPLLAGLTTALLLVALAIPALALWLRQRGADPLPPRLERIAAVRTLLDAMSEAPRFLVADRRLIAGVTAWNALIFLTDAATLVMCHWAIGAAPSYGTAFVAFMAASIVVTLGPIPLGLGTFEATSVAMLHMLGVPVATALGATLLLRSLTLWLPLIPGLVLMRGAMKRPARRGGTATAPGSRDGPP